MRYRNNSLVRTASPEMPMNEPAAIQTTAYQIATWLARQVSDDGFPARSFYGEAFTLWLWQFFPGEFEDAANKLHPIALRQLTRQDMAAHPEFNAWALLHLCRQTGQPIQALMPQLPQLNNTPNSNWLLLGTLVRLMWNQQRGEKIPLWRLRWHTRLLLAMQQQADGLIRDDRLISRRLPLPFPYGRTTPLRLQKMLHLQKLSLQYHCFSLVLLWDILQITGWGFVKTAVQRGHQAIGRFILANGDTLYIGRGQQQIFGYGALIYFLAALAATGRQAAAGQLEQVWAFVQAFQREDGRFPLVLRPGESGYPKIVDTSDPCWLGWYGYNNLFDYLPFLGVMLARAAQLQSEFTPASVPHHRQPVELTPQFAFVRQPAWQMTLAAPGGALSQDQPMPYLCLHGQSILPCFGGEEGDDKPYRLTLLPLPYLGLGNGRFLFLRHEMSWQFIQANLQPPILLIGRCRWGRLLRYFRWEANKIVIEDSLTLHANRLPAGVETVYPLVFTAFELAALADGRFQITPSSVPAILTLKGQQGKLDILPGYTPAGSTQTVREALPWPISQTSFQRRYTISWTEQT